MSVNPASTRRPSNSVAVAPLLVPQEAGRLVGHRVVDGAHVLQCPQVRIAFPVPHGRRPGDQFEHADVEDQPSAGGQRLEGGGQGLRHRVVAVQEHDGPRRDDDRLVGARFREGGHVGLAQHQIQAAVLAVLTADGQHVGRDVQALDREARLEQRNQDAARSGGWLQDPSGNPGELAGVVLQAREA
jgi:hypothetical protein